MNKDVKLRYIDKYKDVKDTKKLYEFDIFELIGYYMSNYPADPTGRLSYDVIENNIPRTIATSVNKILVALKELENEEEQLLV